MVFYFDAVDIHSVWAETRSVELLWPMSQPNSIFKCIQPLLSVLLSLEIFGNHGYFHSQPHQFVIKLLFERVARLLYFASVNSTRIKQYQISSLALHKRTSTNQRIIVLQFHPIAFFFLPKDSAESVLPGNHYRR